MKPVSLWLKGIIATGFFPVDRGPNRRGAPPPFTRVYLQFRGKGGSGLFVVIGNFGQFGIELLHFLIDFCVAFGQIGDGFRIPGGGGNYSVLFCPSSSSS